MLKCFAPTSVIVCKHLFCNLFWPFMVWCSYAVGLCLW